MEIPALETHDLTKTFRKESKNNARKNGFSRLLPKMKVPVKVLDSVSIRIERGEVFGVLGPNGSGKSTLIRIIATLLLPNGGWARVFGHDVVNDRLTVQRMISRVSADAAFFKRMSAMENLLHTARLYDIPVGDAEKRLEEMLKRLDMRRDKLDQPVADLSRGMQQKIAIARAFLTRPELLLLDEPTTGLDPKSKREVQKFIREARAENGATVLLTTHDMEEAEILCDRIAVLNKGKVSALGTPEELKSACDECKGPRTLESVFMMLAGKSIEESEEEE